MMELKITIAAPDLAEAINNLAAALANDINIKPTKKMTAPIASASTLQPATPAVPVNPTLAPVAAPAQAPGAPLSATPVQTATLAVPTVPVAAPVPAAANVAPSPTVPTSAPQYTLEMIATAGAALIDNGKMDQLMQLLGKFGVASLTEIAPASYGVFANELRALGAAI